MAGTCGSTNRSGCTRCGAQAIRTSRLLQGVAHEPELHVLEIAQTAVNQFRAGRRRTRSQVAGLDNKHREASARRVASNSDAVDASADDRQVVDLSVLGHPASTAIVECERQRLVIRGVGVQIDRQGYETRQQILGYEKEIPAMRPHRPLYAIEHAAGGIVPAARIQPGPGIDQPGRAFVEGLQHRGVLIRFDTHVEVAADYARGGPYRAGIGAVCMRLSRVLPLRRSLGMQLANTRDLGPAVRGGRDIPDAW